MSCPIIHRNDEVSAAPFCYVVEIKRSPLISAAGKYENGDDANSERGEANTLEASNTSAPSSPIRRTNPNRSKQRE